MQLLMVLFLSGTAPAAETAAEKKAGRTSARVASKDSGNAPEKAPAKATGKRKQADHADEDAANEQSQAHRQVKPETLAALPRKKTRRSVASVHSGQQ